MYILDGPNDFEKYIYLKNILEKQKIDGNFYHKKYNLNELENFNNLKYEIFNKSLFSNNIIFILVIDNFNENINEFLENLIKTDDLPNEVIVKINNTTLKSKNSLIEHKNYINFKTLNDYQLTIWTNNYLKDQKLKINQDAFKLLTKFVIKNQYDLYHEVNKFKNFNHEITLENINKLSLIKEKFSVFDLIDNVFNNNIKNAIKIFKSLLEEKLSVAELIATFSWYLMVLQLIKNSDNDLTFIANQTKININTLKRNKSVADNFSKVALKNIIDDLIEVDKLSKQIKINSVQAMEAWFLRIDFLRQKND
jgi:DNA polymerase III delta subunit